MMECWKGMGEMSEPGFIGLDGFSISDPRHKKNKKL
jgi:hypothetical protein